MSFLDYFSKQSADYKRFRPHYPRALFEFITSKCTFRRVVLDVATGNGQAAVALAEFFDHVIGIDGSTEQLSHAAPHERVEYYQGTAEATGVESQSMDCVTVAQALHWFRFDAFFEEMKRVIVPGGILAMWCYPTTHIRDKGIDVYLQQFYSETMGSYWAPERHYVDDRYQTIDVPFEEIEAPLFTDEKQWSLFDLAGYLGTWSSVQKYKEQNNEDPVIQFIDKTLEPLWGDPKTKRSFVFEFPMRIFIVKNTIL